MSPVNLSPWPKSRSKPTPAPSPGGFQPGDWVRTLVKMGKVPAGAVGTVRQLSGVGGHPIVDVGDLGRVLIRAEHLEPADGPVAASTAAELAPAVSEPAPEPARPTVTVTMPAPVWTPPEEEPMETTAVRATEPEPNGIEAEPAPTEQVPAKTRKPLSEEHKRALAEGRRRAQEARAAAAQPPPTEAEPPAPPVSEPAPTPAPTATAGATAALRADLAVEKQRAHASDAVRTTLGLAASCGMAVGVLRELVGLLAELEAAS